MHPDIPEDGLLLEESYRDRGIDVNKVISRLKQVADEEGLPLGKRERTYNSRLAHELSKWAESLGKSDGFHDAVFRAYFVEGQNIGKIPVLIDLIKSLGLPIEEAQAVLEKRLFMKAVNSDWLRSYETGVTAVPTFMINNKALVGAQPYDVLEKFMEMNGVEKRISF